MTRQRNYTAQYVLNSPQGGHIALLKIGQSEGNAQSRLDAAKKGAPYGLLGYHVDDKITAQLESLYDTDIQIHDKLDKLTLHKRLSQVKMALGWNKEWSGGLTLTENRVFCDDQGPIIFETKQEAEIASERLKQECFNELLGTENNTSRIRLSDGTGIRKSIYEEVSRKLPNITLDKDVVFGLVRRLHLDAGTGSGKSCTALRSIIDTAKRKESPMTTLWMTSIPKEIDQIQIDVLKFEELYDQFVIVTKEGRGFRITDPISDAYSYVAKSLQDSSKEQFVQYIRNALGRGKNVLCAISIHSAKSESKGWDKALELIHTVQPLEFIISDESENAQQTDTHISWVQSLRKKDIFPNEAIYLTMSATDTIRSMSTKPENLVSFSSEEYREDFVKEGIMPPIRLVVPEQMMKAEMKEVLGDQFDNQSWTQDLTLLPSELLQGFIHFLTSNSRMTKKNKFGQPERFDSVITQDHGGLNFIAYVTKIAEANYILKCHLSPGKNVRKEAGFKIVETNDKVLISLAGTTGIKNRNSKIERFLHIYEKKVVLFISCGAIGRGSNIHNLDAEIFLKGGKSWIEYKQRSGRLDRMRTKGHLRFGEPKMIIFPFMAQAMYVIVQTAISHALKVKKLNPSDGRSLTQIAKDSIGNQYLQGVTHTATGNLLNQELRIIVEKLVEHVRYTERIVERPQKLDKSMFGASQLQSLAELPGLKINNSSTKLEERSIDGATDGTDLDLVKKSRNSSKTLQKEEKLIQAAEKLLADAKRELLVRCLYSEIFEGDRAIGAVTSIDGLEIHLNDVNSWPEDHVDISLSSAETKSVLYKYPKQIICVLRAWEQASSEEVSEFFDCISNEDVIRNSRLPKSTGTHYETDQRLSAEILKQFDSNKFEDIACGSGNNLVSAFNMFKERGFDTVGSLSMVSGNDTCPVSILEARMRLYFATGVDTDEVRRIVKKQIQRYNTISTKKRRSNNMYNILTNPPYNGPKKGHPLAPKFMNQALDDVNAGIVSMIVPIRWQSDGSKIERKGKLYKGLRAKLWNRGTTVVKTDVSAYFPNVGESIGYFVSIPSDTRKWIIDGIEYTIENPFELLKSPTMKTWEGVRDKILESDYPRIPLSSHQKFFPTRKKEDLNTAGKGIRTFYSRINWKAGRTHCIPTEIPPDYTAWKVIFNRAAWSRNQPLAEYCFEAEYITSHSWSRHYTTPGGEQEAKNMVSYIRDSKLFRYMLSHRPKECADPYQNTWTTAPDLFLPLLPLDKPYTDTELYEIFNITETEQAEIEKWTK